jgi:hypothetical protein
MARIGNSVFSAQIVIKGIKIRHRITRNTTTRLLNTFIGGLFIIYFSIRMGYHLQNLRFQP